MLISTNPELRILIPSHAVDNVEIFQGILDNSEKDFLKDKLGLSLYNRLCEYYKSIDSDEYYNSVVDGSYSALPWSVLLLNAQRMIVNDALARFAYQQVISINGTGVNVVSGNDYGNADDRLLERGVSGYKKEAAIACNNLLILLEDWAKQITVSNASTSGNITEISEIVNLWKESKYYYLHSDLLIPTADVLQTFLDIYDNRDRFIRLLPDIRFIQDEYIEDAFGEDFVKSMLSASAQPQSGTSAQPQSGASAHSADEKLLKKVRRLIVAYLEERTTVLPIDKNRRLQAHNESISLKDNILATLKQRSANSDTSNNDGVPTSSYSDSQKFKNNQENGKIFVSPLLY